MMNQRIISPAVLLLVAVALLGSGCSKVENRIPKAQFADNEFDMFCIEKFDTNRDLVISPEEARAVKSIHIQKMAITSFKGIEIFTELESLRCDNITGLKELDLSANEKLSEISISSLWSKSYDKETGSLVYSMVNDIFKFDLGRKPNLTYLKLPDATNVFCDVNITNCPNLAYLEMGMDYLNMSISELPNLTHLICRNNEASFNLLNLSGFPSLEYLDLRGSTNLEEIDLTGLTHLKTLYCGVSPLCEDEYGVRKLTINSASATALELIEINGVRRLAMDLRSNSNLTSLICFYDEALSEKWQSEMTVRFPENSKLQSIDLYNILCKELDLSQQSQLETVRIFANERPVVTWPQNNAIVSLEYTDCLLKTIDTPSFSQLINLNLSKNWLEELDLASMPELAGLACDGNKLQSLDLSQNQKLQTLSVTDNPELSTLTLPQTTYLKNLQIDKTNVEQLDVSVCDGITAISAQDTPLKKLFVSDGFKWSTNFILPESTQVIRKSTGEDVVRN